MGENLVTLTDDNFNEIIGSNQKVIIDSWAEWCAPCKAISPVFDQLAGQFGDKITFAKLNTDENMDTSRKLKIMNIPTFMVFVNGELVKKWSGARPDVLRKEVEKLAKN